ncbi:MAG: hypothetical protein EXR95_05850 [Gemmatimonadetes bacterium]|nr:hypothetical protein [Gemmatimonadota bacterium]
MLRWQGRDAAAITAFERARSVSPLDRDVQEQLTLARAALAPQLRPSVVVERDSDGNHMITTAMSAVAHPLPRLGVRADVYGRSLEQGALARTARGFHVSADMHFDPGWSVAVGVGGAQNDGSGRDGIGAWSVAGTSPGRYALVGTAALSRTALDATAALAERGVVVQALDLSGRWTPEPGWRFDAALGSARFRGATDNTRASGTVSMSRALARGWTVGGWVRAFGFAENLTDDYFDPDFYGIAEAIGRWLWEPRRWGVLL